MASHSLQLCFSEHPARAGKTRNTAVHVRSVASYTQTEHSSAMCQHVVDLPPPIEQPVKDLSRRRTSMIYEGIQSMIASRASDKEDQAAVPCSVTHGEQG